jgi:hypothetical protein
MSATAAAKPRQVYRKDLQQLASAIHHLQGEATFDRTADIVPMFAERLMRTERLIALVAAMLVALFLIWVFARAKVEVRTVPEKPQSYWEQRSHQQENSRQVDRGEVEYVPGTAYDWYVDSYEFSIAQSYNRNALVTSLYSAGPPLIGTLPICNADGRFTEAGMPAQKYYRSATEAFDTRRVSFDGSNYLNKVRLEVYTTYTMGSYNKPFDESTLWLTSAPFTITCKNASSNVPSIAVSRGTNTNDVGGYIPTRFGNSAQRSIARDWWGTLNAAIPTPWTSYPPAELKFGPGARVGRFHQDVTTHTEEPASPASIEEYGSDAAHERNVGHIQPVFWAFY